MNSFNILLFTRIQKSRCRSEKKRRDKLNLFVRDLQKMLSPSFSKRLDKSTVLKMTVDYLKIHNGKLWCLFSNLFINLFINLFTCLRQIMVVSDVVPCFDLTHPSSYCYPKHNFEDPFSLHLVFSCYWCSHGFDLI